MSDELVPPLTGTFIIHGHEGQHWPIPVEWPPPTPRITGESQGIKIAHRDGRVEFWPWATVRRTEFLPRES